MSSRRPNYVVLSLLCALLVWVAGALVDMTLFGIAPGPALLGRGISVHEWFYRALVIATILLLGGSAERSGRRIAAEEAGYRRALERTRQEWRDAFDAVGNPLFMHDESYRITRANRAYRKEAALPYEKLTGRPYWEVFPKMTEPLVGCRRALARGEEAHDEITLEDGRVFQSCAYAVTDDEGHYRYSVHLMEDVTAQRHIQEALRWSDERFRLVMTGSPVMVFTCDRDMRYTWAYNDSPTFHSDCVVGHTDDEFLPPGEAEQVIAMKRRVLEGGERVRWEQEFLHDDGPAIFDISMQPLRDGDGNLTGLAGTAMEVTEQRFAEAFQRLALTVFNTMSEAIVVADPAFRTQHVNPAFERITGFAPEQVAGTDFFATGSGPNGSDYYEAMRLGLERTGHWEGEVWSRRSDGSIYPQWLSIVALHDGHDRVEHYVAVFRDDTRRKRQEAAIIRQASYDPLTGLPNRNLFLDRLTTTLAKARRDRSIVALLYLDLDRFKWINDTLGHDGGDELLREVARRLAASVRQSDTVARIGGDEFTVILPAIANANDAELVARSILRELVRPFSIKGTQAYIGGSIGVTEFPTDAQTIAGLLKNADTAMYRAKREGRNTFRFYSAEMNA